MSNYYDLHDILASEQNLKCEIQGRPEIEEMPFWCCSKLAEKYQGLNREYATLQLPLVFQNSTRQEMMANSFLNVNQYSPYYFKFSMLLIGQMYFVLIRQVDEELKELIKNSFIKRLAAINDCGRNSKFINSMDQLERDCKLVSK
jgi:hypothetical protein